MISRWSHLREAAMRLRREGNSIGSIESELGIPRSTLSGWLKGIELTETQKAELNKRWREGLIGARIKASAWHKNAKKERIVLIENTVDKFLMQPSVNNKDAWEIALSFLYLGEGAKTGARTTLGSSDILIARFFVQSLISLYDVPKDKIRCFLHLRADQDPEEMKLYWSRALHLPKSNFGKASIDLRTAGRPTYHDYKGVCLISCGRVEIQRRLMYIANGFCEKAIRGG